MTSPDYIAGSRTCSDWQALRTVLTSGQAQPADWEEAYREYFLERLRLRYLNPIRILRDDGTFQGEGFSIAAIQCSLIEFLESTWQGTKYRFLRKGETLGPFEYTSSSGIFTSFLTTHPPFSTEFTPDLARDFYEGIRCGLLHEARTRKGWRIWAEDGKGRIVDGDAKLLFRNGFQAAIERFVSDYGASLLGDPLRQDAFIRKFDDLCAPT